MGRNHPPSRPRRLSVIPLKTIFRGICTPASSSDPWTSAAARRPRAVTLYFTGPCRGFATPRTS